MDHIVFVTEGFFNVFLKFGEKSVFKKSWIEPRILLKTAQKLGPKYLNNNLRTIPIVQLISFFPFNIET